MTTGPACGRIVDVFGGGVDWTVEGGAAPARGREKEELTDRLDAELAAEGLGYDCLLD